MDKQKERNQEAYTEEQVKDAEAFLTQLKKFPKDGLPIGRLLTIGFMNGLDAAGIVETNKSRARNQKHRA